MSSPKPIINEKGKVEGYRTSDGTYLKTGGEVVARVKNGSTYDGKGQVKGKGDQGLRLF
jgi:hypothetical protein